ncbi:Serum paraoxonase/arylesterase 1 [Lamellibrachia satsuma]|nr:Serum paraoxonase/arylesterase 1 [Lamellibrachia satsuma]
MRSELVSTSFRAVFNLLSHSALLSSAGASVPSSSADVTMLQQVVALCTVGYITLLCSQSACTFSFHKTVCNHQPGLCRLVPGVDKGALDIQMLPNGLAFITSGFDGESRGDILLFDFKKPRHGAHALDIVGDLDRSTFTPNGISIWRGYNSKVIYIFVVNTRGESKDTVEKFRYDEKRRKLYHLRTYRDPTFTHPNDILATGEDSFYFNNYYKFDFKEEFTRGLSLGNVGFYDGTRGRILLAGLNIPISLNTSPDGKYVYTSELRGKRVSVYIRESDNTLTLKQVVQLEMHVGSINVDVVSGHLWVGGHPDGQSLLNHMPPPHTVRSPSQVLRLTLSEDSKVTDIAQVYYNDGRQISASSIAVHYRRYMLVVDGRQRVFGRTLVECLDVRHLLSRSQSCARGLSGEFLLISYNLILDADPLMETDLQEQFHVESSHLFDDPTLRNVPFSDPATIRWYRISLPCDK